MSGKEKVKEDDRRQDCCKEKTYREVCGKIQDHVDHDAEDASGPVVDDPSGGQEVTGLTLVGVAAAWTAIQG